MRLLVVAATAGELLGVPERDVGDVESLACGIGPVDAAAAVASRLAARPVPTAVLHVGIAGCRRGSGIAVGDVCIGSCSTYDDTSSHLVARSACPDPRLAELTRAALPAAHLVPIGTSAQVGGTTAAEAACDVEAMEGFAVLRAADLAGVPAIEVRVVSNEVEEPDRTRWRFDLALERLAQLLPPLCAALAAPLPSAHDD